MFSGCSCCISPLLSQLPASGGMPSSAVLPGSASFVPVFIQLHMYLTEGRPCLFPISNYACLKFHSQCLTSCIFLKTLFPLPKALLPAFMCRLSCLRSRSHSQNLGAELRCVFSFSTPCTIIFIQCFKYPPQTNGRLCRCLSGLRHMFYSDHMWSKSVYCEP